MRNVKTPSLALSLETKYMQQDYRCNGETGNWHSFDGSRLKGRPQIHSKEELGMEAYCDKDGIRDKNNKLNARGTIFSRFNC